MFHENTRFFASVLAFFLLAGLVGGEISLPENSVVLNKPFSVYEEYQITIWLIGGLEAPASVDRPPAQGDGQLILIADDEEVVRKTPSKMLTSLNYRVLMATNGKEAIKIFEQQSEEIDLIILDLVMPEISGRTAFERIKEIDDKAKVIITSGFLGEEAMGEAIHGDDVAFLKKPYRQQNLNQLIASILGSGS